MKTLTRILLSIATAALSFGASAQDKVAICGLELRNELVERLLAQPICDHYSPQTNAGRVARIEALRSLNPACYDVLSADPETVAFIASVPKTIAKNKARAERSPEGKLQGESLKAFYEEECATLANGEPKTDATSPR
jgi:hypothetical protein